MPGAESDNNKAPAIPSVVPKNELYPFHVFGSLEADLRVTSLLRGPPPYPSSGTVSLISMPKPASPT